MFSAPVQAQQLPTTAQPTDGVIVLARPGEATVEILVLNSLGSSGAYRVALGTRLDELLLKTGVSLAQGSAEGKVETTVGVYRLNDGRRTVIYEQSLEHMLAEPGRYPELQDGDVFMVTSEVKKGFSWRDSLTVLTGLSSVVLLVLQLTRSG